MALAKKYQDELPRIKKLVEESHKYFDMNNKRYHTLRNFLFNTTMDDAALAAAQALQRPIIEFNTTEAYVSRLLGEFAEQEPSINVSAKEGKKINVKMLELVEDHMRAIFYESKIDDVQYLSYQNCLSGGFSVYKIYYEYANEMSFDLIIKWECKDDPTMCGFDPLAVKEDKHDGRYCYELFPKTKEDLEAMGINVKDIQFSKNVGSVDWSYQDIEEKIALICDFYEKKKVKTKIVKLSNNKEMTEEQYLEFKKKWKKENKIVPPPIVVRERTTSITKICRYRFIESEVLDYTETLYTRFPLIFVDGNSARLRRDSNQVIQMTRPYHYNTLGNQKLKNLAGQCLGNEMENMVMHKFIVAKEAIPPEYEDAYSSYQSPNTLIFNAYDENNPDKPLPPPREVARVGAPPEIFQSFMSSDQAMQTILGSYDGALGINDNQLSGSAIEAAGGQSNFAAKPYLVRQVHALNSVAQCIVGILPKLYVTPRTIPTMQKDGSRSYQMIGEDNGIKLDYDDNTLEVKVEAGVSFAIEKSKALKQLIALMNVSPVISQFISTTKEGLTTLLDNVEIKGVDILKVQVDAFIEKINKQQAQQQQAEQQQQNPMMMKAQNEQIKLQQDAQQNAADNHLRGEELVLKRHEVDNKRLETMVKLKEDIQNNAMERDKADTERLAKATDLAITHEELQHQKLKDVVEMTHTHRLENAQLAHDIISSNKSEKNDSMD